jgi:hypothetical protein
MDGCSSGGGNRRTFDRGRMRPVRDIAVTSRARLISCPLKTLRGSSLRSGPAVALLM